jgi:AcrR family transcriptional regulator
VAVPDPFLPPSFESAWGLRGRPTKGPKPGLSLERIVDAAVHVASAEGIGAVSMGRVAAELGASPMSLYRYVAAKDELLALMVDAALGPPPPAQAGEDWRAGLTRWAWGFHDAMRRHPWALRVPVGGPPVTPNQVAWMEDALRALHDTRLAEAEKASVLLLLSGYVRNEATVAIDVEHGFLAAADTPDQAMAGWAAALARITDAERFPALRAVLDAGVFDRADDPDDEFVFGLDRILDGVAALVQTRAADPSAP